MAQYQSHYQQEYAQQQELHMPEQPHIAHTYKPPVSMNPEKPPVQEAQVHNHEHHYKVQEQGVSKWSFGLFDCFVPLKTCCLSFFCPCYIFGKTLARNKTGEKDPSGFTGMCCAYVATMCCGCSPILQCMQRQSTREKHGIEGNCCSDFCISCCCVGCALAQEEKESVVRVTGMDPKTGLVYQQIPQMTYP